MSDFNEIRKKPWFKNVVFFSILAFIYFSGFPLWLNVQVSKWQLDDANTELIASYGESVYQSSVSIEDAQGNIVDLSTFKDKPLFINFWQSWCVPCLAEFSSLSDLQEQMPDVAFIFVTTENSADFDRFLNKTNYKLNFYRLLSKVPAPLQFKVVPTSLLLNQNGEVIYRHYGAANWASEASISVLKNALHKDSKGIEN